MIILIIDSTNKMSDCDITDYCPTIYAVELQK